MRAELGALVRFEGETWKVIGISDGRGYIIQPVARDTCEHCGRSKPNLHLGEGGLLWESVEPVKAGEVLS